MLLKAVLLLSLLAAFPASPAQAGQGGFWEYLSQLTGDKDSLERGHGKLGKDITNLKESVQDGVSYMGDFLGKLSPLPRGPQPQLSQDSDSLRKVIRRELESLRVKLSPYVDEVHHQVKDIFHPYADRLVTEIHRNVQELHRSVAPHARATPEQLNQHIQELSAKLTRNARDLHQQIQKNLEQLKAKLSLYPESLGEPPAPPGRYREALAREVQRRVEEFRRDTYVQIQAFTRALDQETEEMRLKLSARPDPAEEPRDAPPPPPVEDLRAQLDALWRDLALSLGGEAGGER
ncbi:apolipoprotein A-V isoform X2 [Neopelma chrysocephalum]|uniref:apolipoprotein A-V isoform X2 n=1 Tax=Neopelma chrysocephalum TaxID=114329 RepID=UPI000FCD3146|nr:apolipoprotein A-V isoform X2 [Neopelma chrysocephalum]